LIGAGLIFLLTTIREVGVLFALAFAVAVVIEIRAERLRVSEGVMMIVAACLPVITGVSVFLIYDEGTFQHAHVFGTHLNGFFDRGIPIFERAAEGFRLQISAVGRLSVPGMFKAYGHRWIEPSPLLYLIVFIILSVGWWRSLKRRRDVYMIALPFYLAVYALWAFDADTRYLLPMLPVLCLSLWYLVEPLESYRLTAFAVLLVAHLAVSLGYWTFAEIPEGRECNRQWGPMSRMAGILEKEQGSVSALDGVPKCSRLILSYLLDRPILDGRLHPSQVAEARWLVGYTQDPLPAGFSTKLVDGSYRLLTRGEATPAASR
jgi:hypothetical protein